MLRFRAIAALTCLSAVLAIEAPVAAQHAHPHHLEFTIRSVEDGDWSDVATWQPRRIPRTGDRVLISRGNSVRYDVKSDAVIRLVQIVGRLHFARDRDTELNVGLMKVEQNEHCSEDGFACDFEGADEGPTRVPGQPLPTLEIGTASRPIPRPHTARIRLHHLAGMDKDHAPAIACCSARMEIHGAPLQRTWLKLAADVKPGDSTVRVSQAVNDWQVGDEVIVTASERSHPAGSYREDVESVQTERRTIRAIDGNTLTLDRALKHSHRGTGKLRSEVANLSRNVVIESAAPNGVRGHTVYHRFSQGGISYARFAHLGKEGVLGRYAIHFHLVGNTMRGSSVLGAAIVDSHNRWITIHGTNYLLVRDCIGYQSVGHGFFMEDGTEVYNVLDRNLGVQAFRGRRLPKQVLSFDPNDGAAFWWANGRNTLVRNVSCENDEYGYRYDMQHSRYFDSRLPVLQPDGRTAKQDVRTIGIWRFDGNEAHSEGLYGMVVAANGNRQPDTPIRDQAMLERIKGIDWTGPDTSHPHTIRNFTLWNVHYALRPHSPSMLMENVHIEGAAYGIYRPALDNHVYRDLLIADVGSEPFNRGMDDASAQAGVVTVDGLTFRTGYGNRSTPLVQISDVDLSGNAATHIRRVTVERPEQFQDRWPLFNRGVGPRVPPITGGVPIYIHDHFGPGRHAKVVSSAAEDLLKDGNEYRQESPLTGDQARVAEVTDVPWQEPLTPVDDQPPATVVTAIVADGTEWQLRGFSHDDGTIERVTVNGTVAEITSRSHGVVDWRITLPDSDRFHAISRDAAGNVEQHGHTVARRGSSPFLRRSGQFRQIRAHVDGVAVESHQSGRD